jgi:hypothetical protein
VFGVLALVEDWCSSAFLSLTFSVLKPLDGFLHLMWDVSTDSYGAFMTLLYQTKITSALLNAISGHFHMCHILVNHISYTDNK